MSDSVTPWTEACQASLSFTICWIFSNSCPLSQWCHPTILSSIVSSSSCLQFFLASGSFPMSRLFASGGQSAGASASVLPMYIQGWFPLGLTGLIFLQSKRLLSLLQHHSSKASVLLHSAFIMVQLSHPYMTTGKTMALTIWTFVAKWCLCFLIHCLGLSQLFFQGPRVFNFMAEVTIFNDFGAQENKSLSLFPFFPHLFAMMGAVPVILVFWMLSFKPAVLLSSFTFFKRLFSLSLLSAIRVVLSAYLRLWYFS